MRRDAQCGCSTIARLLGEGGSAMYYRLLVVSPFAIIALFCITGSLTNHAHMAPTTTLTAFAALPKALSLARINGRKGNPAFLSLDGKTAQLHMLFGSLVIASFIIARLIPVVH